MQRLLAHGCPAVAVLPEVPALGQARGGGDLGGKGLDDDGVAVVKEPAARVGGTGGGNNDDGRAVDAGHEGGFDLPVGGGVLDDAEGSRSIGSGCRGSG